MGATTTTADSRRHLCVVGASGRTGRELVRLAVERGHEVTALARSADKLAAAGLDVTRMVTGDARDASVARAAVRGCDVVVSTVAGPDLRPQTLATDVARALVHAMRSSGPSRLVVTSSHSLVATRPRFWLALARWRFRHPYADLRDAEVIVRDSGLDWTIVRANMLTDRPARGRVHVETGDRDFSAGDWRLSRADFARVLYEEAVGDLHVAQAIEVTGSLGHPEERPLAASEVAP